MQASDVNIKSENKRLISLWQNKPNTTSFYFFFNKKVVKAPFTRQFMGLIFGHIMAMHKLENMSSVRQFWLYAIISPSLICFIWASWGWITQLKIQVVQFTKKNWSKWSIWSRKIVSCSTSGIYKLTHMDKIHHWGLKLNYLGMKNWMSYFFLPYTPWSNFCFLKRSQLVDLKKNFWNMKLNWRFKLRMRSKWRSSWCCHKFWPFDRPINFLVNGFCGVISWCKKSRN